MLKERVDEWENGTNRGEDGEMMLKIGQTEPGRVFTVGEGQAAMENVGRPTQWLKCNGTQGNAVPHLQFMAQSVPHLRLLQC